MNENWFELLRLFHHSCDKHNTPSKVRRAMRSSEVLAKERTVSEGKLSSTRKVHTVQDNTVVTTKPSLINYASHRYLKEPEAEPFLNGASHR
jgi:hypothetical protein